MIRFLFEFVDKVILFVEFCIIVDVILLWVIVDLYNKYRRMLGIIVNFIFDFVRRVVL